METSQLWGAIDSGNLQALTGFMTPETREPIITPLAEKYGYTLKENEDFLVVLCEGKEVARYHSTSVIPREVRKFIQQHMELANFQDYQMHIGNED